MNEVRRKMLTTTSENLDECRVSISTFLQSVINDFSIHCQNKTDADLTKSLKHIKKLQDDFSKAIGVYIDAVETDQLKTPNN